MTSIKFELEADIRQDKGKGASRRLRHSDKVPAIIYGANKEAISLTLDHNKVAKALSYEAFYSKILTLKIGKDSEKVILKGLQRHPARPRIMHMDFLRISADKKLHMQIPLHFLGEDKAPGLKEGGVFTHNLSSVEVACLPADLPEYIEVDVSNMALDDTIHLTHIKLPKGVELVAFAHGVEGHDLPVVSLHIPRIIEEPVAETPAEGEATAEGQEAKPAEGGAAPAAAAPAAEAGKDKKEKKD